MGFLRVVSFPRRCTMKTKYEIIEVNQAEITVDVSLLAKTEEMFFDATQMAKPFGKKVKDFLRTSPTKEYTNEIFKEDSNPLKKFEDLVQIKKGRYGGGPSSTTSLPLNLPGGVQQFSGATSINGQ